MANPTKLEPEAVEDGADVVSGNNRKTIHQLKQEVQVHQVHEGVVTRIKT